MRGLLRRMGIELLYCINRDKWGRFLNVPKGHLRTVPICPMQKTAPEFQCSFARIRI